MHPVHLRTFEIIFVLELNIRTLGCANMKNLRNVEGTRKMLKKKSCKNAVKILKIPNIRCHDNMRKCGPTKLIVFDRRLCLLGTPKD